MGRNPARFGKAAAMLAVVLSAMSVSSCLDIAPKVLGQPNALDFSSFNGKGSQ